MSETDRTLGLVLLEGLWAMIRFLAEVPGQMMELLLATGEQLWRSRFTWKVRLSALDKRIGTSGAICVEKRLEVFNGETCIEIA